ncbi:NADH-quinone oxidoreductase subunit M [Campylobacter sp. RM16187]|uniref:NADH-quinone oxidoreductase subunit M n=1 Tax=Campylobacter sp. RM16187 TaxID=1660063 RepID=UPI0021B5B20D|nr:NADH-quinone oxidoreductase subunit M [Campylobacter sp. RM16187]QKG29627.1 NADH:quinone oxidoreductase I, membrane subunit M [Campylobacter sp. RM16187]
MLSLIIFFPALAAMLGFLIDEKSIKVYGVCIAFIEFLLTLFMWFSFSGVSQEFSLINHISLIGFLNVNYTVGVDGISLFLVILSSFTTLIGLISLNLKGNLKHLIISILFLEMTMMGVFLALDAILFYIFWELSLLPMLYIIGAWGSGNRIYAAIKFFIYTFFGSVFMLVAILAMAYLHYKINGIWSFSIVDWQNLKLPLNTQIWLFLAFFIAFAVKTPMFPFHTWLPYAHGQAPTIGSVLLAAVLLKMGTYGFVRFSLPMFPDASVELFNIVAILAIVMVIYTALIAYAQDDMKQVIAYSSISHMGVIVLGIFAMNVEGISGAIFMMISHGVVSGALFLLVGIIYERRHTKMIGEFGGLASVMPKYALVFCVIMLGSIGLPLTIGFVGEFLSLVGIFKANFIYAILGGIGIIVGAIYMLNLFRKVFYGVCDKEENLELKDLNLRELITLVPLCLLVIYLGVSPNIMLKPIDMSVNQMMVKMYNKSLKSETKEFIANSNRIGGGQ